MLNLKQIFIMGTGALFAALLWLPVYLYIRKDTALKNSAYQFLPWKLAAAGAFNFFAAALSSLSDDKAAGLPLLFILMVIADFDLICRRIPSEFLLLFYAAAIPVILRRENPAAILSAIAFVCCLWVPVKKRIIGLYDVLMILPLVFCLESARNMLCFAAFILILWGVLGLMLQRIFKKPPGTKIPLVPLILTAFLLARLLP